jgi:hypothetical protein
MKKLLFIFATTILLAACGEKKAANTDNAEQFSLDEKSVNVVYFHGKQRCKTCLNIQEIAKNTIAEQFAGNENVKFVEIDFSEKANEALAEKYEIAWSSLVVVKGENFENMTDEAFSKANNDADGLKSSIVDKINEYMGL